jgi:putative ABC transport system permease protein
MRTLRIALRALRRRPSFTVISVLTLALGLGATAAIFTVLDGVILSPLPYPEPDELVRVEHPVPGLNPEWRWGLSEAGWFTLLDDNVTLDDLAVFSLSEVGLAGSADVAEPVTAVRGSANLLTILGATTSHGRLLRWEDNEPDAPRVAVLSHGFWRTRLSSDPQVVGTTVRLEGTPVEVVGVLSAGVTLPDASPAVWLPLTVSRDRRPVNSHWMSALGRLADGVSVEAAEADLRRVVGTFGERMPEAYYAEFLENSGFDVDVVPMREHVVGEAGRSLWVLLSAVGIVLLIGCVNVANLFLVRMEGARREHALRLALGGSWWDRARQSLAESLLLTTGAALAALLLAWWGIGVLMALGPDLPRLDAVSVGWRTVVFTVGLALLAGVLLGFLPAARRSIAMDALREGAGLTASRHRNALRGGLVVGEIALALVVLVGAGLMLRTFQNLRSVDPGLDPAGVLTVQVALPAATYGNEAEVAVFYRSLTERVEGLPGVTAAGATQQLPLAGGSGCALVFTDDPTVRDRLTDCFASTTRVTPGYFRAMGIPVEGREPTWDDVMARRGQALVSAPLSTHVWGEASPLRRGIKGNGGEPPFYTVEGVAGPVRATGLDEPPVERVYFPMLAVEGAPLWGAPREMTLVVRTTAERPAALAAPVRRVIAELEPTAAVGAVRTMEEVVARSTARTTFVMVLLGLAAALSLILGVVGLYGVVAFVVEQRRGEIGIRMALGARAAEVHRLVVGQAARLAGIGVVLGLAVALIVSRVLSTQLFGVDPNDPMTLGGVALLLGAVAVAAAWIPARRASGVEPMRVLRGE